MAGTKLEDFREKHPEYEDWSDEDLADALHEKHYPEWERSDFNEAMGLEPPPPPVEPPSMWERTKAIFSGPDQDDPLADPDKADPAADFELPEDQQRTLQDSYDDAATMGDPYGQFYERQGQTKVDQLDAPKDTGPTYGDQLWAGLDTYLAGWDTQEIFDLGADYQTAEETVRGVPDDPAYGGFMGVSVKQLKDQGRAIRADAYMAEPEKYPEYKADWDAIQDDKRALRETIVVDLQETIDRRNVRMERQAMIPYSESTEEALATTDWTGEGGFFDEFTDDPFNIMAEVSLRSLPNMAESIPLAIAGGLTMGPGGIMLGVGVGAARAEYRASYMEFMTTHGVDMNNARDIMDAIDNPEFMAEAHQYAATRGGVIGVVEGLTAGIATRTIAPLAKTIIGKQLTNAAIQTGIQGVAGGVGEYGAIGFTEGFDVANQSAGQIGAEAIGELPGGVIEVGVASVTGVRAQVQENIVAKLEAEAEAMLSDWVVDDPAADAADESDVLIDDQEEQTEATPEEDQAEEGETIVRHDNANWKVTVDQRYADGQMDVTVTDGEGNTTGMTLAPGESFIQAVEIADAAQKQPDVTRTDDLDIERDDAEVTTEDFLADKSKADTVRDMQRAMKELREQFPEADFLGPENEQIQEMLDSAEMDGMFNMLTEWFDLTEDEQVAMEDILDGIDIDAEVQSYRARIEAQETAENPEAAARLEAELIDYLDSKGRGPGTDVAVVEDPAIEGELMDEEFETTSDEEMHELWKDDMIAHEKIRAEKIGYRDALLADPDFEVNNYQEDVDAFNQEIAELDEYIADRQQDLEGTAEEDIEGEVIRPEPDIRDSMNPDRVAAWTEEVESMQNRVEKLETEAEFHLNDNNPIGHEQTMEELAGARQELAQAQRNLDDARGPAIEGESTEIAGAIEGETIEEAATRAAGATIPDNVVPFPDGASQALQGIQANTEQLVSMIGDIVGMIDQLPATDAAEARTQATAMIDDLESNIRAEIIATPIPTEEVQAWIDNVFERIDSARLRLNPKQLTTVKPIPPSTAPPKWADMRLKRRNFREQLQQMANEIQVGGGSMGTLTWDDGQIGFPGMDRPTPQVDGRLPSENPEWFIEMNADPDMRMRVTEVNNAVNSAIAGKRKLGVRQARVVQHMLDLITGWRDDQVSYAREQLDAARALREDARADAGRPIDPDADIRGEIFDEDEYASDMTADSRIIREMMAEAIEVGIDEDVLESMAIRYTDNQEFMNELQGAIDEQRHFRSAQESEARQSEQQDADAAAAAERTPIKRSKLTAIQQDAYDKIVALGVMFTGAEFMAMPTIASGKPSTSNDPGDMTPGGGQSTMTVNTLNGLVHKGYMANLDPSRNFLEGRYVALDEYGDPVDPNMGVMPAKEEPTDYLLTVPWTMSSRGDGDLYIQRIGPNAGTAYETRQGPNDIAITFNQDALLPSYMLHLFRFLQKDIQSRARGTAQQAIRMSDIDEALVEHFMRQVKENDQLEMYLEEAPVPSQAGAPGMQEAKEAAVSAVEHMRAVSPLGRELAKQLAEQRRTDLVGQTIGTTEDLAVLAQIYRDPRMETLRVFFTDVHNNVVAQVGLTSRLPGSSPGIIGDNAMVYLDKIAKTAKDLGALNFYMQHNHPSGFSKASPDDVAITRAMAQDFRIGPIKMQFRGHVVINHNTWSEISARGEVTQHEQDLGGMSFIPKGGIAGPKITSPGDAAMVASQVAINTTDIVLIHVNNQHIVLNVSTMPGGAITDDRAATRRRVQKHALSETGTARIIAVGQDASLLKQLDGLVLDAFQITGEGTVRSLAISGEVTPKGDFQPYDRPVRISPDTSEAFDYLRPWAQQVKADGMNFTIKRIREDFDAQLPAKKLQISIGPTTIEVLQNPTPQQFRQLRQGIRMEYQELGYSLTDDPITRSTWDENGNQFVWPSDDGIHAVVERSLAKHLGVDPETLNQNNQDVSAGDLFGQDTAAAQAIQDEIARRDAIRNTGQESIETGDPQDLFSDARKQDDLFAKDVEYKVESRRGRYTGTESDQTRNQRIRSMPMEELQAAVFTDTLTGAGNLKAYNEEAKMLPVQAIVDADSLKWVNTNLGFDAGDAMLVAIVEALNQADVEVYRIGGDEFVVAGWNEIEVRAALTLAEGILANQSVESPTGTMKGINITFGIGRNKPSAGVILMAKKNAKEKSGERAATGEKPPGAVLSVMGPPDPRPLDMQSGSNYVSMIGRHGALPINENNNLILGNGRVVRIPKKPVRREHILAIMRKFFGGRFYEGRVKGNRKALGFYRPGQGEIRLKDYNDIETAAHEVAHYLDDSQPWIKELYTQYRDEVKSVSYDVTKLYEGYAEFMRLYFTQESEAMARTPAFYDAWRAALAEHPELEKMVEDVQELMHAWTMQGARKRGASKMGSDESFWSRVGKRFPIPFWQGFLDGVRSIKKAEIDLGDIGPEGQVAYEKARIAVGGGPGLIDAAFRFGTPGYRADGQGIEFTGKPLAEIFGKHWGDHDVGMYFLARRAQELQWQGRENLMRPDEIKAWLQLEEEIPGLRDMHDDYQDFNSRMLDFFEQAGILNADTRAKMEEMNKNYVPFFRVVESRINGRPARSGGNPFQRLKGGTQNVEVVWDNIIEGVAIGIQASLINDAKREILRKLGGTDRLGAGVRNQAGGLWAAPISADNAARKISGDQVLKAAVEAMGWTMAEYRRAKEMPMDDTEASIVMIIESMEDGLPNFLTLFEFNQDPKGNVDYYMDNGKKFHFEIMDAALMDSLMFLGPKGTNLVLQIMGGFSATLRRGVVAWPRFQSKNFVRDSLNAWLLSDKIKVPAARALAQLFRRMSNDPMFQEMIVNGGGFANRSQGFEVARHLITNPTELLTRYDRFMGRFENANRLAEYKKQRAAGVGPRRAAILSREISTDFAMRGSHAVARFLAVSVPFLNAHMQGVYRMKRQGDYAAMAISFAVRGAAMSAATLALYSINRGDDRYKELPEDIKDLYWVVFYASGEDDYFLIPKPFESGMLYGTLPERLMEFTREEDGEEFADALLWIAMQTFSLDMVPQAFQPMVDLENNTTFTGAPIIPFYLQNVEASEQFTYYTSETAKEAGRRFGVSPIKMDHIIRGYFGTMGTYTLAASDAMIRAATDEWMEESGEVPTRGETWKQNIVVQGIADWSVKEGPPRRTKYVTDLYEMVREAEKVANTMALMQKRQSARAIEYISDPKNQFYQLLVRSQGIQGAPLAETRAAMNEIRTTMDAIRRSKEMTGDEKRIELWNLTRRRNALARTVMEEIKRAESLMEEMGVQPQGAAEGVGDAVELASGQPPANFSGNVPSKRVGGRAQ